ncbi:hypothetical protein BDQ17DRAFT_1335478 [Cyathus striatus]|nr:hypothetical protein BDQ17DRAFT_1335478 [Cyathus striatus]
MRHHNMDDSKGRRDISTLPPKSKQVIALGTTWLGFQWDKRLFSSYRNVVLRAPFSRKFELESLVWDDDASAEQTSKYERKTSAESSRLSISGQDYLWDETGTSTLLQLRLQVTQHSPARAHNIQNHMNARLIHRRTRANRENGKKDVDEGEVGMKDDYTLLLLLFLLLLNQLLQGTQRQTISTPSDLSPKPPSSPKSRPSPSPPPAITSAFAVMIKNAEGEDGEGITDVLHPLWRIHITELVKADDEMDLDREETVEPPATPTPLNTAAVPVESKNSKTYSNPSPSPTASIVKREREYYLMEQFKNIKELWMENDGRKILWCRNTPENYSITHSERVLDEDHYGLRCQIAYPRIPIYLLRTGEVVFRFSVGGLTDVAVVKGYRRIYVGVLPGKIVQALKRALIRLEGEHVNGDPASALLEILDTEQNSAFVDYYMDVLVDLRSLVSCPRSLRLRGYVSEVCHRLSLPQAKKANGLGSADVILDEAAVDIQIKYYYRKSGVLDKIYCKAALKLVQDLGEMFPEPKEGELSAEDAAATVEREAPSTTNVPSK